MAELIVRGARQHNLKNITLALPRDKLVVITGPSGSGKSSLAFDTIYAEAQRRYVESLSVYARQFLGQMPKPEVDAIEGLSPAICVRQQGILRNPRSTVGTLTEIYDYLRLLYARAGIAHSPATGKEMRAFSVDQVVDRLLALPEDTRLTLAAPVARKQREGLDKLLLRLRKEGFVRVALDGEVHDLGDEIALDPKRAYDVEVHVDRVRVKLSARKRISEAVELSYKLSSGLLHAFSPEGFDWLVSERLMCVDTGETFAPLSPRSFSFNSPDGACPSCDGLGETFEIDPERVVPDASLSIRDGAIQVWGSADGPYYQAKLEALAETGIDLDAPFEALSEARQKRVLFGDLESKPASKRKTAIPWEGVIPPLMRTKAALKKEQKSGRDTGEVAAALDEDLSRFGRTATCPECQGSRLSPLARAVTVDGVTLPALSRRALRDLHTFFAELDLSAHVEQVVARVLQDIQARIAALLGLGLDYLSLDRSMTSLSGGEIERIRLATQFGSGLLGVLYVLDEPSAGLHARDNERLIDSLVRLRDQGNSVLVVEHDEAIIRAADFVCDLGEGAGVLGGRVMALGSPQEIMQNAASPTGRYLSGSVPSERSHARKRDKFLSVKGATLHNLKDVSARFPIAALSCVSGVSGSGKSSLIIDTLLPVVKAQVARRPVVAPSAVQVEGADAFDRVIDVDQTPIGRTPRSNPASYLGAFEDIRELFANLPDARAQGFGPARFSFNVKGGRCEVCRGDGVMRVDMQFLPDTFVRCESCGGRRYNRETLDIRYRGYSIADVLDLSAEAALALFAAFPKLSGKLSALCDVGLGYVALGQPANTLSGGEAQRVKLARELSRRTTGRTLLVLDEPTVGLHFQDVALLVRLLQRLVDAGNTVIVIEHHLDVVAAADHVVDMGPEGGPGGGEIVASGTPQEVAASERSHTARYLRSALARL